MQNIERVIELEKLIYDLEPEYKKFIKENKLSDEFHNVIIWLDTKGVIK